MSYAAFKMVHSPTGVENCAAAFLTHSAAPTGSSISNSNSMQVDFPSSPSSFPDHNTAAGQWGFSPRVKESGSGADLLPNLVITKGNVIELYRLRLHSGKLKSSRISENSTILGTLKREGDMAGISSATLELISHHRLNGNVESMAVLSHGRDGHLRRDAIMLTFRDAKISVLDFDEAKHSLRTSSLHYFEGPDWQHLKGGREKFSRGPLVRSDPHGRCAGVLLYGCQLVLMKAAQVGFGLGEEDESTAMSSIAYAHIEFSYVVSLRDMEMKHIKDFVFLHGYIEPVAVVLHEKEPTWAGRIAMKSHTCAITALSINTTLKQHPVIWSADNLPFDAYKLLPVPAPIGGVLVVCANSLHYHSQSSSCSLALNDFAVSPEGSTQYPKSKISVEFDASNATWISHDVALFSTKTGNLFLLSLAYDGRAVQKLELSKSRASVLSSCICTVGNIFFFLGSRLGDSLLVQFTIGSGSTDLPSNLKTLKDEHDEMDEEIEGPSPKRLRRAASDVSHDAVSVEELSLHYSSSETPDSLKKKTFNFAVRDSLVNIGPLRDFAYGFYVNPDSSSSTGSKESNYELVACSGHGKNGSISILQRSIRPKLITEVELPGCKGIWTVYYKIGQSESSALLPQNLDEEEYHAYLIISLESRTMVLETGEMLGEVTESVEYYTEGPTIFAGNLFGRRRVVQVYARGIRLLDGTIMTQDLQVEHVLSDSHSIKKDEATGIAFAAIADPFILLRMTDGNMKLIIGDTENQTVSASASNFLNNPEDPVTACTLHHDKGHHWFRKLTGDTWHALGVPDLLEKDLGFSFDQGDIYCIICRESGKFEIYELPGVTCVYCVENFTYGFSVLIDSSVSCKNIPNGALPTEQDESKKDSLPDAIVKLKVVNVCMETWGEKFERPFLFTVLNDGTVLCYHAFCYEGCESNSVLEEGLVNGITNSKDNSNARLKNLRFVRIPLDLVTAGEEVGEGKGSGESQRIIPFTNIGGMRGVFITGARPMWLMICREHIRPHQQHCEGSIMAFTPLHNINCTHGLIYISDQGFLKICQLPALLNYDNDWPVQKVLLRGTPHQITYHGDTNLYALIVSFPALHPSYMVFPTLSDQFSGLQTDQMENPEAEGGQNLVNTEDFEVRIMKPSKKGGVWETKGTIKMQVGESAITARIVSIKNVTTDQMKNLLAIGTAHAQGEDVAARGRIILVVVGPESDDSNVWAKEIYSKEMKGAISAIASLQGHLLVAIGTKIILHTWNGSELNGAAFFDAPLYVVSLNVVKNFVLFGDIHKSIYFLCWKEEGAQLILLAKDFGSLDCFTTEFLIDGTTLSLLVSDSRKNVQIFSFAPKSVESWKGQKLLSRAEFHLGAHVAKFLRLQMLPTPSSPRSNRFSLYFGTLDGSIAFIAPLDELTFRRLQTLQRKLVDAVAHVGGLNPRSFRQFRSDGDAHRPGPDNIVDCELLSQYEMLPLDQQVDIARQIGTTRSQILANFRDLILSTNFF